MTRIVPRAEVLEELNPELLAENLAEEKQKALVALREYDFDTSIGSGAAYITNSILVPCLYFSKRQGCPRTAAELAIAFNNFQEICAEANKYTVFVPTLNTFAAYCNITTKTLKNIANENNDRGNIASMIIEKLSDGIMQNIMTDKIHPIGGIFVAKANFGMRDNDPPQMAVVNVSAGNMSIDEIMADFNKNNKN